MRYNAIWVRWAGGWHLVGEQTLAARRSRVVTATHITSVDVAERLGQYELDRGAANEINVRATMGHIPGEPSNIYRAWRPGDQVRMGTESASGLSGVGDVVVSQATLEQGPNGKLSVTTQFGSTREAHERKVAARLRATTPGFLEAAAGAQSDVRAEDQTILEGPQPRAEYTFGQQQLAEEGLFAASPPFKVNNLSRLVSFDATCTTAPSTGTMYVGIIASDPFSWRITRDVGELPMTATGAPIQLVFPPGRKHALAMVYDCVLNPWQTFRFAHSQPNGAEQLSVVATFAEEARS